MVAAAKPDTFDLVAVQIYEGWSRADEALLARGAPTETKCAPAGGQTGLHLACLHGHADAALAMLTAKAQIEACDEYGLTPLHCACRGGHVELALRLIFPHGANAKARSKAKRTCYHDFAPETRARILAQAKRLDDEW